VSKSSQKIFIGSVLVECHGTFHDTPNNKMNHLVGLTFKTSLDEQEMASLSH